MRTFTRRRVTRRLRGAEHRPITGLSDLPRYDDHLTASATRIQFR